ncbi:MAG TPA: hypothetical protein VG099_04585 [Gemmataceae bacterium]|nr:hypothetical protein [Gemmataceae bacterium]
MCYPTSAVLSLQQAIPNGCPAKALPPSQRLQLGLQALAGAQTITDLADQFEVSRKFVYCQSDTAERALTEAFAPQQADDQVLFHLPVTKQWLRQLTLGLVLSCHSPLRGVVELLRDHFDYDTSLGTVFNVVRAALPLAQAHNHAQDLSLIRVGGHDEIFQADQPVLVGVDLQSTYCYLLSLEEQCDADTWGVRLLELITERGFHPDYVVADAGNALRAGLRAALPDSLCRSDIFHLLQELTKVVTIVENRAYAAMATGAALERKIARTKRQARRADLSCLAKFRDATKKQARAIALADDLAMLGRWLHYDVLGLAGPSHADRVALYDFILAEVKARVPQAANLLGPFVIYLQGQRDDLLAFAAQLDSDFAALAAEFAVSAEVVRELFAVQTLALDNPKRWRRDAPLRRLLGACYFPLSQELDEVQRRTVRASSLVENLNSRLRSYFFLRRHIGNEYLGLLQFFLNHRCYERSEHPERRGKSPAELLTGQSHPHWLELLGCTRFSRN